LPDGLGKFKNPSVAQEQEPSEDRAIGFIKTLLGHEEVGNPGCPCVGPFVGVALAGGNGCQTQGRRGDDLVICFGGDEGHEREKRSPPLLLGKTDGVGKHGEALGWLALLGPATIEFQEDGNERRILGTGIVPIEDDKVVFQGFGIKRFKGFRIGNKCEDVRNSHGRASSWKETRKNRLK
jgi:hypothetical protein